MFNVFWVELFNLVLLYLNIMAIKLESCIFHLFEFGLAEFRCCVIQLAFCYQSIIPLG
jgi:hypothetical protein